MNSKSIENMIKVIESSKKLGVSIEEYVNSLEPVMGSFFVLECNKIIGAAKILDVSIEEYVNSLKSVIKEEEVVEEEEKNSFMYEYSSNEINDPLLNEEVKVEIVFSFDTTGSMSPIIKNVRENLEETIERLFKEVKGLRIGLISHGDYCDYTDRQGGHCIWKLNPTNNVEQLKRFIKEVPNTGGGDADECYELVLKVVNDMTFKSELKVLVLIGDNNPHELNYSLPVEKKLINSYFGEDGKLNINWKEEVKRCKEKGIVIFGCHAMANKNKESIFFYDKIVETTGGYYFTLENLQEFQHYMNVIVLKVADTSDTIESLKEKRELLRKEMEDVENKRKELERKEIKTEEEIKELKKIYTTTKNLTSAFCDLSSFDDVSQSSSIFRSPVVRREFNTRNISGLTRTASYAMEVKSINKDISESAINFINTMSSE